ncbi:MAG: hypothetical protein MJ064_09855, partial [Lachnospiraceae bacterium]|nr:hypothetical protein [Lachnospiraceae bacterium]
WGTKPAVNKTGLIIKNGTFDITWAVEDALTEEAKENFVVSGGKFTTMVPADYIVDFFIAEEQDGYFAVVPDRVAQIGDKTYSTLTDAIAAVPADGTLTTITLLKDFVGQGIVTKAGQNIVIDFNSFTYNVDKTVGSAGTETNGFQLLKGSKVTLKNGTLTSNTAKILIQNYSELTVLDMNLDGTKSSACNYVVSNNNGSLDVLGDTSITASPGKVAFDVCVTSNYPDGVVVTIDTTGTVTGAIEYDLWGTKPTENKTGLIIKNGTFDITWAVEEVLTEEAKESFDISGGKFSVDVPNEYLAEGLATTLNTSSTYFELVPAVAMVDGITYASFADAASAAGNKKVITLLSDIDSHTFASSSAKLFIKKNGFHINITCTAANYMLNEVTDEDGITTFSCVQDPSSENWVAKVTKANGLVTYYTSLSGACSAAVDGSEVLLLKDIESATRCTLGSIKKGDHITLDLGGHTLTNTQSSDFTCIYLRNKANVTVKNGHIIATRDDAFYVPADGSLVLSDDVTVEVGGNFSAVLVIGTGALISSATITVGDNFAIAANGSAGQAADITILGGSIKSDSIAIY